jgi:mono/diheme cytochrome c family protein
MRIGATFAVMKAACVAAMLAACAQEEYPLELWNAQHPQATDESSDASLPDAGGPGTLGPAVCLQSHAESLPARLVAMSANAAPSDNLVLVSDLFQQFSEVCAPCHTAAAAPPGQGGFQIAVPGEFATTMTPSILAHVTGAVCPQAPNPSAANDPMPPCSSPSGATYSTRSDTDPIQQFATLVQEWFQAGSPPTSFTPPTTNASPAAASDAGAGQFVMTAQNGNAMTNIGNCVPSPAMFDLEDQKSLALDTMFAGLTAAPSGTAAQMIGLPEHLGETDLFTFDSAVLAQYGVVAYAPGYPLWSDDAGKLRYVRVPRGQSIQFNKATQQFEIPPNTRFYKTFMKQIVDTDGSYRYRKIETRLIVSRPDQNNPDGTAAAQTALYGTYLWNADESDATLVETPLHDGKPFADTLLLYNTDEQLAADLLIGQPNNPSVTLVAAGAARHYAIPSSARCVQCHEGSPSQSFVLGFTPLQINRRPDGVGGNIEATGADELTQLQRFIDLGIITGITSPSDVLPLEQSQGSRTPRNPYELTAQGYVLGNCAHCHNPRGYPTVQNPVLSDVLNFLPSATGGLFQFPLERYSPRIGRGLTGSTPIPYITPSLVDLPKLDPTTDGQTGDWFTAGTGPDNVNHVIYAPWRSIIYRNVESSFAYTDDYALFPHMPMNTPGYDPRAKQILGDWMVSIPSVRKRPDLVEYAYQTDATPVDNIGSAVPDTSPQPYVEVTQGSPEYDAAAAAAQTRLSIFQSGQNAAVPLLSSGITYSDYTYPGDTGDIEDPAVLQDPICHPIPVGDPFTQVTPLAVHPHWVSTDLTLPPGPWGPRQPNWPTVLVEGQVPPAGGSCSGLANDPAAQGAHDDEVMAVSLLPNATLNDVETYATTPVPFGLWEQQPGCDFSSQPTVQSFTGASRPHWMDVTDPPPTAPVYSETPGAAVFKMICINCHGPMADANGRLAQNLATMTGGNALVADFRDGLFGPVGAAEIMSNRHAIFGVGEGLLPADASPQWTQVTDDDRAARYMAWMGLGGTSVNIPVAVLQIVAITKVLDQVRTLEATQLSANMLSQAKALCLGLLGPTYSDSLKGSTLDPTPGHGYLDAAITSLNHVLIPSNGDAEMWLQLCSLANQHPVHVLPLSSEGLLQLDVLSTQNPDGLVLDPGNTAGGALIPPSLYPAATPVGDERGGVDPSLATTNEWPWCVDDTAATGAQTAWIAANNLPVCPDSILTQSHGCATGQSTTNCFDNDAANQWAVRGAINAGLSVFTYVRSIENSSPPPDFNQCSQLP